MGCHMRCGIMACMHSSRASRAIRGAVAAGFATFTALMSHVLAGAEMPGWLGVVAPLIFAWVACTFLSGRRLSAIRLTVSVLVSQFLFHSLFVLGAPSSAMTTGNSPQGHRHGAVTILSPVAEATVAHDHGSVWMWGSHAAAALVTIAGLYFAERIMVTASSLVGQVREWLARISTHRVVVVRLAWRVLQRPFEPILVRILSWFAWALSRRGPPLVIAV